MNLRALVVDDPEMMRNTVTQCLTATGLADFEVPRPRTVLRVWRSRSPDLYIIFVDWNMPNMSGIDFARRIRASRKNCRVPDHHGDKRKDHGKNGSAFGDGGVSAFITKPFTAHYLHEKLAPVIQTIAEQKQEPKKSGGFFSKLGISK